MKKLKAKQIVNILRTTLYVIFDNVIVDLLMNDYAMMIAIVDEMRDERLKNIMQIIQRQTKRKMKENSRQERQKMTIEMMTRQKEKSVSDL